MYPRDTRAAADTDTFTQRAITARQAAHFPLSLSLPSPSPCFLLSIVRGRHFWRVIAIDALCFCRKYLTDAHANHSWTETGRAERERGEAWGERVGTPAMLYTGCSECLGTSRAASCHMQHATGNRQQMRHADKAYNASTSIMMQYQGLWGRTRSS